MQDRPGRQPGRRTLLRSLMLSTAALPLVAYPVAAQDAPQAAASGTSGAAPEIVSVIGHGSRRNGFVPKGSNAATKTDTPLIDTPQAVSVVTRAQMDQQNARTLGEALRYTSGIASENRGFSTRYDQISIRGFNAVDGIDEFLDGLKLFNGAFYATQQIDPFLLERVDVLKGPPSVLYGQASPGGVVVLTSKLPVLDPIHMLSIEGGTFGYVRGTADFGGALDKSGHFLYRLAATGTTSGAQDEHTRSERYAVAPSVSWLADDQTTLTINGFYQHDPRGGGYGTVPLDGSILPNRNGEISENVYTGDNGFEKFDRSQASIGYQLEHHFNDDWTVRSVARYAQVGTDYRQVYGSGALEADDRTLDRSTAGSKEHYDTITLEEQILGHFDTGPLHHSMLAGVNWQNLRDGYNFYFGSAPSIDIFAPNSNQAIPSPSLTTVEGVTTNQEAIFAEDQIALGRLHLQIGGREDWSAIDTRNQLYQASSFNQFDRAFTWRAGILYAFPVGLSPYFNYARSFQPANSVDFSGHPFVPTKGEQYEVGLKFQPRDIDAFVTAALFHLTESHVLVADPDPAHLFASVQTGGIRSQGIELEAHANITRRLNIIAAYTYQDVSYESGSGALVGKRPTQIPAQYASLWGHYDIGDGRLAGLGFGAGVRYNGNTLADQTIESVTPNYTLVDAQIQYALGNALPSLKGALLQVTAQNLLDTRYVSSCYSASFGCFFGASRNVIGKLTYRW
ncbi:TonB-dependent siderophore receptor [Lichenicola cladoniae]|uniref:TonB-dependent siderophore receptor n=1 Tax=Lichenicola cladoniae TaxID=1484109 RepID=A0A6M8HSZ0_9PROT|nr:TonB-dependent siderophore receptor [Lichenicola cladoniae]NPD65475.1 TonB-dependent siderophore receptor [Acetobacteraceae bacterium]QKE91460.1 TonB-dependent siderophore receptor [Lichenicola cladoniae]